MILHQRFLVPALLLTGLPALAQTTYTPTQVHPRDHAAYLQPNGTIQIVSQSALAGIIAQLNTLFLSTHPGTKFALLSGDNYAAMAALTFDRTPFAPLGSEYTRIGLGDNLKIAAEPLGIRIAHASLTPGPAVPALGVIVNPANPIASLSLAQLTRIFAVGGPAGDIATWSQASVKGPLADRPIHPFGPLASDYLDSDDPQAGEFISTSRMAGLNMTHTYTALPHYADIVQRIAEDPAAIGIVALNQPLTGVKLLPLKGTDAGQPISPDAASIAAGRYPFDRAVYIYLRLGKGQPVDPFAREYLRMVLSDEGQRILAAGPYIPLNPAEQAIERARLDQ